MPHFFIMNQDDFQLFVVEKLNETCERLSVVETINAKVEETHTKLEKQSKVNKVMNYIVVPILSGGVVTALVSHFL